MDTIFFPIFQLLYVAAIVALVTAPVLLLVWIGRTLSAMRRSQAATVRLLTSIEAELRAAGDRERWPRHPE